ncbi:MAG: hypothetical protein PWQ55_316 [Chloroflexota bacterium]|nr:hypothetical protein [Chloroflexota bacterium]
MASSLNTFFEPKGVAIIGASDNPDKLSHGILRNLLEYGYSGGVYPVNPKSSEILGKTCYADISQVPDPLDMAVIILPAPVIPAVLKACGERGVKVVTVISGGFKEIGEEGKQLEGQILEIIHQYGMRMIGPNCVGSFNLTNGMNTTFIKGKPATGGIGFISQSGAVCGGIVDHVLENGIGFSHFLSLGNEADVSETDMMEVLADDKATSVIAIYAEGIQDGQRFIQSAHKVTRKKPVVVLKAGRSDEGARAVSSHTGSLAGSHAAYQAAFKQSGVIEVQNSTDLLNVAMALDWMPLPKGKRTAIVTNAGGPAALASDSLAENGLELAHFSAKTEAKLREKLNPAAQVGNPVDMLGGATEVEYGYALDCVLADDNVDMALGVLVPQALVDTVKVAQAMLDSARKSGKPVLVCIMGAVSVRAAQKLLHDNHLPMVDYPESSGVILGALKQYADYLSSPAVEEKPVGLAVDAGKAKAILSNSKLKNWGEHVTRPLLEAYGVPLIPGKLAHDFQQALDVAQELGYPLVMKVASQDVLHKSDYGAIAIDIRDDGQLENAYNRILENVHEHDPNARIEGVLLEKMAGKGQEVIVGMKRDPGFGPLMMFGMGGIFVELFKDVAFRVAPLTRADAQAMLEQTKAVKLLSGWRGGRQYDTEAIIDTILRLSQLAVDFPQIQEIEINPLLVLPKGQGALALDCRMILE